jgi:sigma-B regulation protein RsbU (phosphoserine phosphatase)
LEDVVQSLQALSEGRSTVPVRVTGQNDEIGRLAGMFESFRTGVEARTRLTSLQQELDVAARIQRQILPSRFPATRLLTFCGRMQAARDVGGDFYDVFELPDGRIGCVIADVSGKGMGAALFMAAARTAIRSIAAASLGAADCIAKANDYLESDNDSMMFVTVFYAIVDAETGELCYCNAGHNPPAKLSATGQVEVLSASENPALGVFPGVEFIEHATILQPGERLFLFTDGITEAMTGSNEEYGDNRLADALSVSPGRTAEHLADTVLASVAAFVAGAEQSDDITCLAIAYDPDQTPLPKAS